MKKAVVVLLAIFVFIVSVPVSVGALNVDVSEEDVCMVAPYEFSLNITNTQDSEDIFYVNARGAYSKWAWVTNKVLLLKPGESGNSRISVHPPGNVDMDKYTFQVNVFSKTNRSIRKERELCFIVFRNYSMEVGNFSINRESYEPEDKVKASVAALNTGSKDFKMVNFTAKLKRSGEVIDTSSDSFELETDERKVGEVSFKLDKYQSPGKYEISYRVVAKGRIFDKGDGSFEVESITDTKVKEFSGGGYLSSTRKIKVENLGNTRYRGQIVRNISYPYAFLVSADKAEIKRKGIISSYRWEVDIKPGESQTFQYQINYWPIYILLIIIAFGIFRAFLYLQVPRIKKEVMKTELSEDERIFTISIEIENWLFGKAKNVVIEDAVPSVARVIEDFDGMEPDIERGEETKLRWQLGDIDPRDSRVLHYKIKTLVEAVDYLKLPKATLRGHVGRREFERESSKVQLEV